MRFALRDIELTQPLPSLQLGADESGVAVIGRMRGNPVGFAMRNASPGSVLDADEVSAWLGGAMGASVIEATMRNLHAQHTPEAVPTLTIAVCTKDHPDLLARCLASMQSVRARAGESVEVMVIDNASVDARTREVTEAAGVRCILETQAGLDFARNLAVREAKGRYIAFIDDDAVLDRAWYDGFLRAVATHPDAGAITGVVLPLALDTEAQILFERHGGFRRGFSPIRHGPARVNAPLYPTGAGIFGAGCNMVLLRELVDRLGGFDDALDTGAPLPGGGDLDIFYRVVRSGHPLVYEPTMAVHHEHRRELAQLRRQYWTWGLGFMAFVTRSWRTDRAMRSRLGRLVLWWFVNQFRQLFASVLGKHSLPPRMLAAELAGGIVGLAGEYDRSRRRTARIRAAAVAS